MNRKTQMTGLRLGFTYAAALVLLAFLIAMVTVPSNAGPTGAESGIVTG